MVPCRPAPLNGRTDERRESRPHPPSKATTGERLTRRGWLILLAVVVAVNIPLLIRPFRPLPEAGVPLPFADDFSNPATVSAHYHSLGGFPGW